MNTRNCAKIWFGDSVSKQLNQIGFHQIGESNIQIKLNAYKSLWTMFTSCLCACKRWRQIKVIFPRQPESSDCIASRFCKAIEIISRMERRSNSACLSHVECLLFRFFVLLCSGYNFEIGKKRKTRVLFSCILSSTSSCLRPVGILLLVSVEMWPLFGPCCQDRANW